MADIFKNTESVFSRKLTLKRAILSYVMVFIIPTIVMTLLVQVGIINSMYKQAKNSICDEIKYTKLTLEQQLRNFSTIVDYIFFDPNIESSDLPRDYLKFIEVQTELKRISATNALINELLIYIPGSEYIISTRSSYKLKHYLKMFSVDDIENERDFYDFLNEYKEFKLLPGRVERNDERQCMFFYFSNNVKGELKYTLIFTTLESAYHSALKKALGSNMGCSFITDTNGNIISYYSTDKSSTYEEYFSILSSYGTGTDSAVTEYNGYLIYSLESDFMPIRYSIVVNNKTFFKQTSYIRLMWYGVIFIVMLFGVVTALLLGRQSYKPINSLRLKASTLYGSTKTKDMDDYHYLYETMEYMSFKNTMLQNSLDDINDYIIFKLLKGDLVSTDEINRVAKLIGISVYSSLFKVIIIKPRVSTKKREIYTELLSVLPESINIHMRSKEDGEEYVVILVYDKTTVGVDELPTLKLKEDYTINRGSIQTDIRRIPLSYMEAEIGTNGSPLYNETCAQLEDAVYTGNLEGAEIALKALIDNMMNGNMTLTDAKLTVIRFTLLIADAARMHGNHVDVSILPDTFMILRYESINDALLFFECHGENLITELLCPNTMHGDKLYSQMVIYLKNHYCDFNFSFQQMADEFNMTLPVLSRQFYSFTGKTLSDFTTDLKIATAKSLLTKTNLSINEVGMEVGYYNVNSFIRWFKKSTNETPGNFRKHSE